MAKKVIRDLREDCACAKLDYCPMAAWVENEPEKFLEQHKMVEAFKWEESKIEGREVPWKESYRRWMGRGLVARFMSVYSPKKTHEQIKCEFFESLANSPAQQNAGQGLSDEIPGLRSWLKRINESGEKICLALKEIRRDCPCFELEYCPLEIILRASAERFLMQNKLVEAFKYDESTAEGREVSLEESLRRWAQNGFAEKFARLYATGKNLKQLKRDLFEPTHAVRSIGFLEKQGGEFYLSRKERIDPMITDLHSWLDQFCGKTGEGYDFTGENAMKHWEKLHHIQGVRKAVEYFTGIHGIEYKGLVEQEAVRHITLDVGHIPDESFYKRPEAWIELRGF